MQKEDNAKIMTSPIK